VKVRIINRPSGLINGVEWPAVGETIDLPDVVGQGMLASGDVEKADAKKAAAKPEPGEVETRPAPAAGAETRKRARKA
jgi:hypothetical protein